MKKGFALLASLIISSPAWSASESHSLVYDQAKGGGHKIFLMYPIMSSIKGDLKSTANATIGSFERKEAAFDLKYLYGFSDNYSIGLQTSFGTDTTTTTVTGSAGSDSKETGMGDIFVWGMGWSDMGGIVLRYGGNLGINMGNKLTASSTKDGSRSSGGISLAPYIAAEMSAAGMNYGLGLHYKYLLDRKIDSQSGTVDTVTGGSVLTLMPYLEVPFTGGVVSAYFKYEMVAESKKPTSVYYGSYNKMGIGIKGEYEIAEMFAIEGGFSYASLTDYQPTGLGKMSLTGMNLDIGAVFRF